MPNNDLRADAMVDALGFLVAFTGQALRAAVIGFAYIRRGGKNKKVYADDLVVEGFFAHCRNPLYVGNAMVLLGLSIVHGAPVFIALCIAFYGLAYWAIVAAEENFLFNKFGDQYRAYCSTVNRFIPNFAGLRATMNGMEYDWQRVLRKEYGSTFTWVLAVIALMIYERLAHFPLEQMRGQVTVLAALVAPLLVAYVVVRVLKKKKLLGRD